MNTAEVFAELDQHVYEIQLARDGKMNALTDDMYGSLVKHLQYAEANSEIKVIFLRSNHEHFTAGNDLHDFVENEFSHDSNVIQFLNTIASLKKPLVCAVGGAAVGIGTTLLLHCDLVYASEDSNFSLPFIKLGLTPEGASSKLLAQKCGSAKAHDWLLTGRIFLAEEALQAGLVNQLFPDTKTTWDEARKIAQNLAKNSTAALLQTKALLKQDEVANVIAVMQKEAEIFSQRLVSPETQAAFKAFLNRGK